MNPQAPVAQKTADEVVFRHVLSQMVLKLIRTNEIEEKKTMLIHTNQPLMTSFYIKNVPIF